MKIIRTIGCLALSGTVMLSFAACKRPAPDARTANANVTVPASTPVPKKASNTMFRTETKTPTGEDIYRMETGGIKFVLPKTWTAQPDEQQMALATEDNALRIVIMVPENEDYDGVVNGISDELARIIPSARPNGVAMRTKLNGMEALTQNGFGELDDATVSWKLDVIKAKRPIIILSYSTVEIDDARNAEYSKFMDSVLPLG